MFPLYLGIDLGGSGTRAALAGADGHIVATGTGPSGLHGRGSAGRRHLKRALDAALAAIAPTVGDQPCRVFAGTRGLSIPGRRENLQLELTSRFRGGDVQVSNDALIALWGGLAGRQGVAVLAGSGSIALARTAGGHEGRAGGWGYLLGDEGSGYWLGREALAAYLRALEGREPVGALTRLVGEVVGRASLTDAIGWLYVGDQQVERLARLAPLVTQAAHASDPSAQTIAIRAGQALADAAAAAARQVWPTALPDPLVVACCGGVWSAGPVIQAPFAAALAARLPGARCAAPHLPPIGGALLLAMGAAERPLASSVLANVRDGL